MSTYKKPLPLTPRWFKDKLALHAIRERLDTYYDYELKQTVIDLGQQPHLIKELTEPQLRNARAAAIANQNLDMFGKLTGHLRNQSMTTDFNDHEKCAIRTLLEVYPQQLKPLAAATNSSDERREMAQQAVSAFSICLSANRLAAADRLLTDALELNNAYDAFNGIPGAMLAKAFFPRDTEMRLDPLPLRHFGHLLANMKPTGGQDNIPDNIVRGLSWGLRDLLTSPERDTIHLAERVEALTTIPVFAKRIPAAIERTFSDISGHMPEHLTHSLQVFDNFPQYESSIQAGVSSGVYQQLSRDITGRLNLIEIEQACESSRFFKQMPNKLPHAGRMLVLNGNKHDGFGFIMEAPRDGEIVILPQHPHYGTRAIPPLQMVTELLETREAGAQNQCLPLIFEALAKLQTKPQAQPAATTAMNVLAEDYQSYQSVLLPPTRERIERAIKQVATTKPAQPV